MKNKSDVPILFYKTEYGHCYNGNSLELLKKINSESVNLVITSPPFALLREKEYGNRSQESYIEWLLDFCKEVFRVLKNDGSFVIDLGGAYQQGKPIRSLYNFKLLIELVEKIDFKLAEEFYWHNPSKLPSPIEWVNKKKIRVKDSVNTVWWLAKSNLPKADVKNVLVPYSDRMLKLLENPKKFYKAKARPSGHEISKSFGINNGGAIPSNLLSFSNNESNGEYFRLCAQLGLKPHPARFPARLPEFFVKFLTHENDIVLDIFSGSNTTGEVCEKHKRFWIGCDLNADYVATSALRFINNKRLKVF
jgi:site-specific DNA-methyltransferase (cytosine-N4-specific)